MKTILSVAITSLIAVAGSQAQENAETAMSATYKAREKLGARDAKGAIALVKPFLGACEVATLETIFHAKLAVRDTEVLEWANAVFRTQPYSRKLIGIWCIASAYGSLDTSVARANALMKFQETGIGDNPLKNIKTPNSVALSTKCSPVQRLSFEGDNQGALIAAVSNYAAVLAELYAAQQRVADTAGKSAEADAATKALESTQRRFNLAVDIVAGVLWNIDGNPIRATNFVKASNAGEEFDIAELQNK